jgi:hypothetical protein
MTAWLPTLILTAGVGQAGVLVASSLVPFRLDWKKELASLSTLHRQMYWIYGGYVVLSIIAFAAISIAHHTEIAAGSGLGRAFCGYVAIFWGIRLALQAVLDVKAHLTVWWLKAGYHLLTVLFAGFTALYGYAALPPG